MLLADSNVWLALALSKHAFHPTVRAWFARQKPPPVVSSEARRNAAGVHITDKKSFVTSAGHADSYVVSALAPEGAGPTDSTLYLVPKDAHGLSIAGAWDGLGLRANASAPMTLEDCEVADGSRLTDDGAGFQAMLQVVLPLFNL